MYETGAVGARTLIGKVTRSQRVLPVLALVVKNSNSTTKTKTTCHHRNIPRVGNSPNTGITV